MPVLHGSGRYLTDHWGVPQNMYCRAVSITLQKTNRMHSTACNIWQVAIYVGRIWNGCASGCITEPLSYGSECSFGGCQLGKTVTARSVEDSRLLTHKGNGTGIWVGRKDGGKGEGMRNGNTGSQLQIRVLNIWLLWNFGNIFSERSMFRALLLFLRTWRWFHMFKLQVTSY